MSTLFPSLPPLFHLASLLLPSLCPLLLLLLNPPSLPFLLSCAEFEECIRGRTVSMVWACQEPNKRMKECLTQR